MTVSLMEAESWGVMGRAEEVGVEERERRLLPGVLSRAGLEKAPPPPTRPPLPLTPHAGAASQHKVTAPRGQLKHGTIGAEEEGGHHFSLATERVLFEELGGRPPPPLHHHPAQRCER